MTSSKPPLLTPSPTRTFNTTNPIRYSPRLLPFASPFPSQSPHLFPSTFFPSPHPLTPHSVAPTHSKSAVTLLLASSTPQQGGETKGQEASEFEAAEASQRAFAAGHAEQRCKEAVCCMQLWRRRAYWHILLCLSSLTGGLGTKEGFLDWAFGECGSLSCWWSALRMRMCGLISRCGCPGLSNTDMKSSTEGLIYQGVQG